MRLMSSGEICFGSEMDKDFMTDSVKKKFEYDKDKVDEFAQVCLHH
jgi:hypothetical protein